MSIPQLAYPEDDEYVWYVSDRVATVGLWRREGDTEFPIYQQTRGEALFNSRHVDEGNIGTEDPTAAFFDALLAVECGEYDPETDDGVDVAGCEWYEVEFLDELLRLAAQGETPISIKRLSVHAQVRDGGGDE